MAESYTHKNLSQVEDQAAKNGLGEHLVARVAGNDYDAEHTGFSHIHVKPGKRQPFAHRHEETEEVYVVVSGSGRAKLDDEVIELLAFGPRNTEDPGEVVMGWWSD